MIVAVVLATSGVLTPLTAEHTVTALILFVVLEIVVHDSSN